jgi:hypothetical protein
MSERQFTTPMIIENDEATPLARVLFDEKSYDESWLRDLLWRYPSLLPVAEIEPVFDGLLPVKVGPRRRCQGDSPSAKKWDAQFVFMKDGKELPLSGLAARRTEWLAALKRLIERAEEPEE